MQRDLIIYIFIFFKFYTGSLGDVPTDKIPVVKAGNIVGDPQHPFRNQA